MPTIELSAVGDPWTFARCALSAPAGCRLGIRGGIAVADVADEAEDHVASVLAWIGAPLLDPALPVIDLAVGVIATVVPALVAPAYLRFATDGGARDVVSRAKATCLLVANRRAAAGLRCGWLDGPVVRVDPARADPAIVRSTVGDLAAAIRALDDPHIAESFLDYCAIGALTKEEAS